MHGEAIDQYIDVDQCEKLESRIERSKQREIAALDSSDPQYGKRVQDIERRAKITKYLSLIHI